MKQALGQERWLGRRVPHVWLCVLVSPPACFGAKRQSSTLLFGAQLLHKSKVTNFKCQNQRPVKSTLTFCY